MTIVTRELEYQIDRSLFAGAIALDDARAAARPAVMVCHGWEGRSDAQVTIARSLAELGCVGFAGDLFGKGIRGDLTGDNSALIAPFLRDRAMLRARLIDTSR